jgi:predicted secreted acid phosphatase
MRIINNASTSLFVLYNKENNGLSYVDVQLLFGKKWIVLPNLVFGTWMNALPGMEESRKTEDNSFLEKGLKGF